MSDCDYAGNETCFCSCHRSGAIHMVACCAPCFICGRNIQFGALDQHKKRCMPYTLNDEAKQPEKAR